jgi:hypothetical protein
MEHVFRNTVAGAAFVLGMGFLSGCSENYTSFEECKDKEMAKAGESRSKQTEAWSYCKKKFNYKSQYELEKEAAYAKIREEMAGGQQPDATEQPANPSGSDSRPGDSR